jgi:hypothetical protein
VQILHLNLLPLATDRGADHAELRYFFDNPNDYQSRMLPLQAIADLIALAETEVYVPAALQDLVATGRRLYDWLDGSDRWLGQTLEQQSQDTILAIAATAGMANLPWELLHDSTTYLVQRLPSVVPVRWVSQLGSRTIPQLQPQHAPQNRALNLMFMATSPRGVEPVLHFEQEEGRILKATERQPLALLAMSKQAGPAWLANRRRNTVSACCAFCWSSADMPPVCCCAAIACCRPMSIKGM